MFLRSLLSVRPCALTQLAPAGAQKKSTATSRDERKFQSSDPAQFSHFTSPRNYILKPKSSHRAPARYQSYEGGAFPPDHRPSFSYGEDFV